MALRAQRVAFMLLAGLDHFAHDLITALPVPGVLEVQAFYVRGMADLDAACAWADDPAQDAIWFEFCWPPFPATIAQYDFGGRRVLVRVHRIEAYETGHAAGAPWHKIDDVILVSTDMAARLGAQVPRLERSTGVHVVHNGVDVARFLPGEVELFRIGWCGLLNLRKNPNMALEILHLLRQGDPRWHMHMCSKGGEPVAVDSFNYLRRRLGLDDAVVMDGDVAADSMPAWHGRNSVLLSTSVHESFGYAMAEAASCGCDVVMLDQIGAAEFWPDEMRFGTAAEAAAMIKAARQGRWRDMVVGRFSLAAQVVKLREILMPVLDDGNWLRIGVADELLDILARACGQVKVDMRTPDEMEAATFLLDSLGYRQVRRCRDGVLFQQAAAGA